MIAVRRYAGAKYGIDRLTASAPPFPRPTVPYSYRSVRRSSRVSVVSVARTSGSDTAVAVCVAGTVLPSSSTGESGVPGRTSTK